MSFVRQTIVPNYKKQFSPQVARLDTGIVTSACPKDMHDLGTCLESFLLALERPLLTLRQLED